MRRSGNHPLARPALPAALLSVPTVRREGTAVSQRRHGYRQIRSRTAERPLRDPMITAMTAMFCHPLAHVSSPVPDYRPVYPSSYTPVHKQQKEVFE